MAAISHQDLEIIDVYHLNKKVRKNRYQNKAKKILFNLFREGPKRLLLKIKSYKFSEFMKKKEAFVVCKLKNAPLYLGGFQYSKNQPFFYFVKNIHWDHLPENSDIAPVKDINPFLGYLPDTIVREKPEESLKSFSFKPIVIRTDTKKKNRKDIDLYLIGCGSYVLTEILPVYRDFQFAAAVDFNYEILNSSYYRKFKFRTNDFDEIKRLTENDRSKLGIISSYHSYHTRQALDFLKLPNSKVIIEKPPCVTKEDLVLLAAGFDEDRIFIAYHRRFSKWNRLVKDLILRNNSPVIINMIIQELDITKDHWYFTPNQGTRITANLCHWIDLAIYWIPKKPVGLTITKNHQLGIDGSIFNIYFKDGSIVNIVPSDWGDQTFGIREYIRIKGEYLDIKIADYTSMQIWERGKTKRLTSLKRSKGHVEMNQKYKKLILKNLPSPYKKQDLVYSTWIYISFVELFFSKNNTMELDFTPFFG